MFVCVYVCKRMQSGSVAISIALLQKYTSAVYCPSGTFSAHLLYAEFIIAHARGWGVAGGAIKWAVSSAAVSRRHGAALWTRSSCYTSCHAAAVWTSLQTRKGSNYADDFPCLVLSTLLDPLLFR